MRRIRIAYFVHDLNDAAVARRVTMLRAAGGEPVVIGFRRDARVPVTVAGAPVVDLGQTHDARLAQRAGKVICRLLRPQAMLAAAAGADVVIGRTLEALILAARTRQAMPSARLIYECLDIHRTLLGRSAAARVIQAIEARLLRTVDLLIVSSPAFSREYFATRPTLVASTLLAENKVLALDGLVAAPVPAPVAPPWTIGWLGNLRCVRTFAELRAIAAVAAGKVQVIIAGRASPAVFADFESEVAAAPHCRYLGPYTADDLPGLYARCHFAWAIDYFEEGQNSAWLLPNRLYEASGFGAVPIALRSVETGRWLMRRGAGLLLDDAAPDRQLNAVLTTLDQAGYRTMRDAVAAIPRDDIFATAAEAEVLLQEAAGR